MASHLPLALVLALQAGSPSIEPVDLGRALINALVQSANARDRLNEAQLTGQPYADALSTMVAKRGAIARFREAKAVLAPFGASLDDEIGESAEFADVVFDALIGGFTRSIALDEKMLSVKSPDELPELVTEESVIAAHLDEAWRALPLVVAAVTHALTDSERVDGSGGTAYLRITDADRSELLAALEGQFGDAAFGVRGDQHAIEVSAGLFGRWLRQDWLGSNR